MAEHAAGAAREIVDQWRTRYCATQRVDDWPSCDFVVESIDEDVEAKQLVFDEIEASIDASTPIGSNTSAIPITALQQGRRHPGRFFGMHWFEPAYVTRFLELVPGDETSQETMTKAVSLAKRCGKDPSLLAKDIPGFIVNRLGYAVYREAMNLLELGVADAETIDRSFRNACGVWSTILGPFAWIDSTGGPQLYAKAMSHVLPTLSNATDLPQPLQRLIAEGAEGCGNGRGFYRYGPRDGEAIEKSFHEHAWRNRALVDELFPLKDEPV
jgi:3-hydroxybutyryl-CoA dehydrogenase